MNIRYVLLALLMNNFTNCYDLTVAGYQSPPNIPLNQLKPFKRWDLNINQTCTILELKIILEGVTGICVSHQDLAIQIGNPPRTQGLINYIDDQKTLAFFNNPTSVLVFDKGKTRGSPMTDEFLRTYFNPTVSTSTTRITTQPPSSAASSSATTSAAASK